MGDLEDGILEDVARAGRAQLLVDVTGGTDQSWVPRTELPDNLSQLEREFFKEWWEKLHPKPPPPPPLPDQFSWRWDINFPDHGLLGGAPVGGWTQLSVRQTGSWNFSGHLHDSGYPDYDDAVVWALKNIRDDVIYVFPHSGHMDGTKLFGGGNRNDDWDNSDTNANLADGWASLCQGWAWSLKYTVTSNLKSQVDDAVKALGYAATVISIL
jgi:hypothetical protein